MYTSTHNDPAFRCQQAAEQLSCALKSVFGTTWTVEQETGSEKLQQATPTEENHVWNVSISPLKCDGFSFSVKSRVRALDREDVMMRVEAAIKCADAQCASDQLAVQATYFLEQVSDHMEELAWVRSVAESVAICRPDLPMPVLCDQVLPQLQGLLHSRRLMVLCRDSESASGLKCVSEFSPGENSECADSSRSAILEAVKGLIGRTGQGPIVLNKETGSMKICPDISGLVLVQLGTGEHHYGWILAWDRAEALGSDIQSRSSDPEFGTHEATLLDTTAVLLATHAANYDLFEGQRQTLVGAVTTMVNALDARDPYTKGHSQRVASISRRIAEKLNLDIADCENTYLTGLLHDIGKIGVPDHVLLKNGPLDEDERRLIEQHSEIGYQILKPVTQLEFVLPGVLHHHERIDGTGYPSKLVGDDIPLVGRILAVADAYDAMTTSRPYRRAMPVEKAEAILDSGRNTHWDSRIVDTFMALKDDIAKIYESAEEETLSSQESLLQFGRFEDASLGQLQHAP